MVKGEKKKFEKKNTQGVKEPKVNKSFRMRENNVINMAESSAVPPGEEVLPQLSKIHRVFLT